MVEIILEQQTYVELWILFKSLLKQQQLHSWVETGSWEELKFELWIFAFGTFAIKLFHRTNLDTSQSLVAFFWGMTELAICSMYYMM